MSKLRRSSLLTAAIVAVVASLAGEASAQSNNPHRGGTGYDGGWGSKNQFYEMTYNRGYAVNPNTCFLPPRPKCYPGGGGGYGYNNGGGYPAGDYNSSNWDVTIGGGYNASNGSWNSGRNSGSSRGNNWGVGGSVTFGGSNSSFRPISYQPQPLPYYQGQSAPIQTLPYNPQQGYSITPYTGG